MRLRPCDVRHLEQVYVSIDGGTMYLWRTADAEGEVLDVGVQRQRDHCAALKPMRCLLLRRGFAPWAVETNKPRSYGSALREIGLADRHLAGGRSNDRAENSYQPIRRCERA